jgi:hypothetical protein
MESGLDPGELARRLGELLAVGERPRERSHWLRAGVRRLHVRGKA